MLRPYKSKASASEGGRYNCNSSTVVSAATRDDVLPRTLAAIVIPFFWLMREAHDAVNGLSSEVCRRRTCT